MIIIIIINLITFRQNREGSRMNSEMNRSLFVFDFKLLNCVRKKQKSKLMKLKFRFQLIEFDKTNQKEKRKKRENLTDDEK